MRHSDVRQPLDFNLSDCGLNLYFLLVNNRSELITQPLNYEKISWP